MSFVDQQGNIEFPYSRETVMRAVMEAIPSIDGMTVVNCDELNGQVTVSSGISMASWGEDITIHLNKLSATRTQMLIQSGAKVGTTLIDMGKNKKNVDNIINAVSAILQKLPVEDVTTSYGDNQPTTGQPQFQQPAYQQQPAYRQQQPAYQPQYGQPYRQQPSYGYQPNYAYQPNQMPPKPDNSMVWSILSTLFCCLPFGIVAIVYSSKVDSLYHSGNYTAAQMAASSAKNWNIAALILGLLSYCSLAALSL